MRVNQLGIIPSWQFNTDANTNPLLNPHVEYPPGMYQTTVQPVGPYYNAEFARSLQGLRFPGDGAVDSLNTFFDSWGWRHRKLVFFGAFALLTLSALGAATSLLK